MAVTLKYVLAVYLRRTSNRPSSLIYEGYISKRHEYSVCNGTRSTPTTDSGVYFSLGPSVAYHTDVSDTYQNIWQQGQHTLNGYKVENNEQSKTKNYFVYITLELWGKRAVSFSASVYA